MIALPVIERELRQQARRPSGTWVRVVAALLAGVAAVAILGSTAGTRIGGLMPGQIVFTTLSLVVFVFCLFEGVRQTSDSLAREKRDGTLGLLLLTDLRALDVVLGKLAATSVGSFYALLAVFPAMSMALPYGGVTAGEFWRTQLVLLDTLFLGLSVGLWASARQHESGRALIHGLGMIAVLTLLPMTVDFLLQRGNLPNISPGAALSLAGDRAYLGAPPRFWTTLLAVHAVAWTFLLLAGRTLLRSWQDEEQPATLESLNRPPPDDAVRWAPEGEPVWTEDLSTYRSARSGSERPERALIEANPAKWLAAWVPRHKFLAAASVYLLALGAFSGSVLGVFFGMGRINLVLTGILWLSSLLPWLLLAYVASRPLADARSSGSLELLLSTPIPLTQVVQAYWMGLWRQLAAPVYVSGVVISIILLFGISAALTAGDPFDQMGFVILQVLGCASRVVTGIAVCRMGLYLGLKANSLFAAIAQNLFFTVILFWMVTLSLNLFLAWTLSSFNSFQFQFIHALLALLGLAYSGFLIHWSRRKLLLHFRELAAQTAGASA
jgi:hypothetical protein